MCLEQLLKRLSLPLYPTPFAFNLHEMDRIFLWRMRHFARQGTFDMFSKVEIETTTACNRACGYCPNSRYSRERIEMPEELFQQVIMDLKDVEYGGVVAPHLYGEPLLDSRLPRLVDFTREKLPDARIWIYTNGDCLSHETYRELRERGANQFIVTCHEGGGPAAFLSWFSKVSRGERKGIVYRKLGSVKANRGGVLQAGYIPMERCIVPSSNVAINAEGKFLACCNDYLGEAVFGDLWEQSVMGIWGSDRYKKFRADARAGKLDLGLCKRCGFSI